MACLRQRDEGYGEPKYDDHGYGEPKYDDKGYYRHGDTVDPPTANVACHHHDAHKYSYLPYSQVSYVELDNPALAVRWNGSAPVGTNYDQYNRIYWGFGFIPATDADKKPGNWEWEFYPSRSALSMARDGQPVVKIVSGTLTDPDEITIHGLWGAPSPFIDRLTHPDVWDNFEMEAYAGGAANVDTCFTIKTSDLDLEDSCLYVYEEPGGGTYFRTGRIVPAESPLAPYLDRSFSAREFWLLSTDVNSPATRWRHHPVTFRCVFN